MLDLKVIQDSIFGIRYACSRPDADICQVPGDAVGSDCVIEVAPTSREEFAQFIRAETARWARVIKDAGIPQQ